MSKSFSTTLQYPVYILPYNELSALATGQSNVQKLKKTLAYYRKLISKCTKQTFYETMFFTACFKFKL